MQKAFGSAYEYPIVGAYVEKFTFCTCGNLMSPTKIGNKSILKETCVCSKINTNNIAKVNPVSKPENKQIS
jgi:hypothetical protein